MSLQPDSYYTQRDHDRQASLAWIQAERDRDQRNRDDYDKQPVRVPGSLAIWRDTPVQHTEESPNLRSQQAAHEQVRVAQEQKINGEANQDRAEQKH